MIRYYYSALSWEQQQIYLRLLQSMGQPSIPCDGAISDIHGAVKALLLDYPELCFFEGKWGYDNQTVYPRYVLPGQSMQQLGAAVKSLHGQFSGEAYPRQIYDWMLTQVEYCRRAVNSQNAYGALVQRQAVCKGIAKGYQLLMAAGNIDCILVEGTLDGQTKHVWNMIRYDGSWKHVDVTMGYPCFWSLTGAVDSYGGYCRTTAELSRSHKLYRPDILPAER